jgi:ATP-dependent Lhr-like helicase
LVLAADTASGKTEAVFLPICSRILEERDGEGKGPAGGPRAVYVAPLRALINDQFERLRDLCGEVPVFKGHGDVATPEKRKRLSSPGTVKILLITPESIESLFINHPEHTGALFGSVSWVVVDELHAFMGTERGAHLRSLLARMERVKGEDIRLLALSATVGDADAAKKWLRPGAPGSVEFLRSDETREVRYRLKGYAKTRMAECARDLIRLFPSTSLVFVNSKRMLEYLTDTVKKAAEKTGANGERYRVHHGSLSKGEREDTEENLKAGTGAVTFCSSTLELGIDVGGVDRVGQFGAPWSVASLRQRLGRSGRRSGPSTLALFIAEGGSEKESGDSISPEPPTSPFDSILEELHPELLQAAAMSELLFERWCEPPDVERPFYSTLVQQVLSVVAEKGSASALSLYGALVEKGAFRSVSREAFGKVLRALARRGLLEETGEGLILGLAGERVVRSRDFYAAFTTPEEAAVVWQGQRIGSIFLALDMIPDGLILLAGRRWKITLIDMKRNVIAVEPAQGGKAPPFGGETGPEVHARVRYRMKEILAGRAEPAYFDEEALAMLRSARRAAKEAGVPENPLLARGRDLLWLTWESSAAHRALFALSLLAGLDPVDHRIALEFRRVTAAELTDACTRFARTPPAPRQLAEKFGIALEGQEKYDRFLPDDLLLESYGRRYLDLPGALAAIRNQLEPRDPNLGRR